MTPLTLTEGDAPLRVDLTDDEARALAAAELAVVSKGPGELSWSVAPGRKVGVIRIGDRQVTVRPKVSISRLIFLMGYARQPSYWRDQSVLLDGSESLPEALAHSFGRLATHALARGPVQSYRTVEDALPTVRGRIRVADQISRRFGRGLPLEVTYDDFTVDVAENRILLSAADAALRFLRPSVTVRQTLLGIRQGLSGVTPLGPGESLPRWQPTRLNTRYHGALRLAELILGGHSFEQRHGELEVSGFVVDMWKVFEDFVCVALKEALESKGGAATLQNRMFLDEGGVVDMRPDFVWRGTGGAMVVTDAKYKAERPAGFPQADVYQMLAYCTVLQIDRGHLIYAKGEEPAKSHSVIGSGITIETHSLDLEVPPSGLLQQIDQLASRVM